MRSDGNVHIVLRYFRFVLAAFLIAAFSAVQAYTHASTHGEDAKPLVFGIVPQQSSAKLIRDWSPVLTKISELSGLKLRFATAPSIPEFEARLAAGEYDIAYMNPYHFTVFNASPGYQAIARARDKQIKGILVVNKDAGITSIEQLQGKDIAFPAPAAFAATLLTQAILRNQGITFTPHYVGSHDSSYMGVADGLFAAGGGVVRTLGSAPDDVKNALHILFTTGGYTPHAIATHPSVSEQDKQKLQQAFLALSTSPSGLHALEALNISGFEAASDKDWDDVRALNISILDH